MYVLSKFLAPTARTVIPAKQYATKPAAETIILLVYRSIDTFGSCKSYRYYLINSNKLAISN